MRLEGCDTESLERNIDQMIFELYNLSSEEIDEIGFIRIV